MTDARLAEAVAVRRAARRLLSAADVAAIYDRMAREIAARLADSNPIVVAVMHGGVFTAVELSRRFDFPHEFAYVHATRYRNRLVGGELEWHVDPPRELAGRTVLIVDDILDVGVTLGRLQRSIQGLDVAALLTAVFAVKQLAHREEQPQVDFVGTSVEDVYVFGCGMDYKGYWRGLPELLAVAPSGESS